MSGALTASGPDAPRLGVHFEIAGLGASRTGGARGILLPPGMSLEGRGEAGGTGILDLIIRIWKCHYINFFDRQ